MQFFSRLPRKLMNRYAANSCCKAVSYCPTLTSFF